MGAQVRCRLWVVVETDKAVLWTRVAQGAEGDDSQGQAGAEGRDGLTS